MDTSSLQDTFIVVINKKEDVMYLDVFASAEVYDPCA